MHDLGLHLTIDLLSIIPAPHHQRKQLIEHQIQRPKPNLTSFDETRSRRRRPGKPVTQGVRLRR
jgi:hypothetical protein